ncbi:MAG: ATP-binding protein [Nitrospiraceae bacterium]|nr:ATP-binding protein [Nitrospiraceae bacterium]
MMEKDNDKETRLRQLREQCELAREELMQALDQERKVRADLQQFVNIVSHDLRSPISTTSNFLALISTKYGGGLDPKAKEYIGYCMASLKGMEKLVSDLLAYAKIGARRTDFQPSEVDMNEVLEHALSNLRAQIKNTGGRVSAGRLPGVKGDEPLLVQLFQNLLSNALTWSGNPPEIDIAAESGDGQWIFSFRDNGLGIKPEDQKRIFEPFGRTHHSDTAYKTPYKGTGLGLPICRKIVELHGGLIWVESAPGLGSTFHFTLPKAGTKAPGKEP